MGCTDLADRDAARLHCFRNFAHEVDDEAAVLEAGTLGLDMVGQCELAPEGTRRNAAMQEDLLFLLALAAFKRQHILLDGERDLVLRESGQSHRNSEAVLVETLDVVGGIARFGSPLDLVENVKKAVEADGRPPQGSPIIPHSQILLRASWVRAGTGHLPMPAFQSGAHVAPRPHLCVPKRIFKLRKSSRG